MVGQINVKNGKWFSFFSPFFLFFDMSLLAVWWELRGGEGCRVRAKNMGKLKLKFYPCPINVKGSQQNKNGILLIPRLGTFVDEFHFFRSENVFILDFIFSVRIFKCVVKMSHCFDTWWVCSTAAEARGRLWAGNRIALVRQGDEITCEEQIVIRIEMSTRKCEISQS